MHLSRRLRQAVARTHLCVCLVNQGWFTAPAAQAMYEYAVRIGKPIRVLVLPGTRLPEDAFLGVPDVEIVHLETWDDAEVGEQILAWRDAYQARQQEGEA